jgi:hypothetical protein
MNDCQAYISDDFEKDFDDLCKGKTECDVPFNVTKYVSNSNSECVSNSTRVYWQIFCSGDVVELNTKRSQGLLIVTIGIFMSCLYLFFVSYL